MVTELDWARFSQPSEAVITGVSIVSNTPPENLDPLYDRIDPDVLDSLFDCSSVNADHEKILHKEVRFLYSGCLVIAKEDRLLVRKMDQERAS